MSLFTRRRVFVPAAALLLALANAQTCYYPDGKSISTDIPCNPDVPQSACCPSNSFCLADGLCYGAGAVSRGSCTDQSWGGACAQFCTEDDTDTSVTLTPCASTGSSNTFACGVGGSVCSATQPFTLSTDTSLVLRPAQVAALVNQSLSSNAVGATVTAVPAGYYSGGAMAGLAIGIAIPLLLALGVLYMMLRREQSRFGHSSTNKNLMYKLPDEMVDDLKPPPPPTLRSHPSRMNSFTGRRTSHESAANSINHGMVAPSVAPSRRESKWTIQTASSQPALSQQFPPNTNQTFLERYETMKARAQAQSQEVSISVASVPGTPTLPGTPQVEVQPPQELPVREVPRYELSDTRMST